jgi:glutamate/tyrosine decarboxylase-like PLP-dependent enzyme
MYDAAGGHPELEPVTQHLSITTFRFVPLGLPNEPSTIEPYLNNLNEELLNRLQTCGEAFVSNAIVEGKYVLRACIVNFRTTLSDVEVLPEIVVRLGRKLDSEMRPEGLRPQ